MNKQNAAKLALADAIVRGKPLVREVTYAYFIRDRSELGELGKPFCCALGMAVAHVIASNLPISFPYIHDIGGHRIAEILQNTIGVDKQLFDWVEEQHVRGVPAVFIAKQLREQARVEQPWFTRFLDQFKDKFIR